MKLTLKVSKSFPGHKGRPGQRGGSMPSSAGGRYYTPRSSLRGFGNGIVRHLGVLSDSPIRELKSEMGWSDKDIASEAETVARYLKYREGALLDTKTNKVDTDMLVSEMPWGDIQDSGRELLRNFVGFVAHDLGYKVDIDLNLFKSFHGHKGRPGMVGGSLPEVE